MRNLREKKSASRIFFESAQRQYRRRLEEDEILPPVEEVAVDVVEETPAEDTIAERRARLRRSRLRRKLRASRRFEEDEVANDEVVADVPAVVDTEETVAERRARLRRKLRNRKARRFEEDEFVEVDEPVFLEDEVVNEEEETVASSAVAERRARLRRRMRLARTKRFRDGFDTEQLGENIRNSVDFTVIKERLAKVKNRPNGVTKFRSGAVVSRANKLGKFSMKMRNGRTVQGIVKYRPNGSVKSFKISR